MIFLWISFTLFRISDQGVPNLNFCRLFFRNSEVLVVSKNDRVKLVLQLGNIFYRDPEVETFRNTAKVGCPEVEILLYRLYHRIIPHYKYY